MAGKRKNSNSSVAIDATRHPADTRPNIPTIELESFTKEAEKQPKTMLYPRDPSLDPQLVWKGKDQQDQADLAVPAVPVYIQEKIVPRALIENLDREKERGKAESQMDFFGDFNGLEFEELVEFYQHSQHWTNRMILGDSLLVMTSLAEKEGFKGQVQMIYMDPPYGIKFGSNWQVSTRKRDVRDGRAEDATRQPEQIRAFRDTWQLGIHSYLAYLRDRLVVARDLLTETGSIFVQIGDENVHLVRCVMDEVFGSENFCGSISFRTTGGQSAELLASVCDHLLWYAHDKSQIKYRQVYQLKVAQGEVGRYQWVDGDGEGTVRELTNDEAENPRLLNQNARLLVHDNITSQGISGDSSVPFAWRGKTYQLPVNSHWKTTPTGMANLAIANRLMAIGSTLRFKRYLDDFPVSPIDSVWEDTAISGFGRKKQYVVETNTKVIERCLLMTTDPGDLVLDPTCGSGTTAYAAEQWGRRWITMDTSRVSLALARTRLMAAKYPYYRLIDTPEGIKKEAEVTGQLPPNPLPPTQSDVKKGFVYERVPHVTLKSIANNPDIHEGMSRAEIDAAIARHADTEILYDRPYTDSKIVRVSGPFTVESLSPHRLLPTPTEDDDPEIIHDADAGRFVAHILENLRKHGVQNTVKKERLNFDSLESWPGEYIQASGEYTESGKTRTVAVAIGPEHGTVGTVFVREAAKEASRFFDLLVVCGFAFEAHVGEETSQIGRLTILKAKMNPDLAMGEELLKKTGAGNLFMVFGEPDITIHSAAGDQIVAEIKGVDVYDPTTGQVRSRSTNDIACWFIDTNYNEESFFVRHAYFLGDSEPYDKLKRALRAEVDEAAWASLYSTKSRPFPRPLTGKIAIKVINHYGDEVLKVWGV